MKDYVSKIQELEGQLLRLKNSYNLKRNRGSDSEDEGVRSKHELFPCFNEFSADCDEKSLGIPGIDFNVGFICQSPLHS